MGDGWPPGGGKLLQLLHTQKKRKRKKEQKKTPSAELERTSLTHEIDISYNKEEEEKISKTERSSVSTIFLVSA
jgi:hypothetical protein